jgi:acyl-CoA thioester hydrolase
MPTDSTATALPHTPARAAPQPRSAYRAFVPITTRWADNDIYGHVNNAVYTTWFDTAVNGYLIQHGGLDIHHGSTIGLVVQTHCNYFAPLAFPQAVQAGIRVVHLGTSSVRYAVGLFAGHNDTATSHACGEFVHVYVDKTTRQPVPIPLKLKTVLETLI